MHRIMTRPTQPRHHIQHLRSVPATFQDPGMRRARDEMMVRQRDPVATAEFAGGRDGAGGAPGRVGGRERRCGGGGDIGC